VVAVGAHRDEDLGPNSGSVYLFNAPTGVQTDKLLPSDGLEDGFFGGSVAMANGVVVVGSIGDGDDGNDSGAAYLFDTSTGFQIAKLLPSDGAQFDGFGFSVAISNGMVAVGARSADSNGGNSGSAYLFDASTGAQVAKLLPSDGAANDRFGWSIGINNGTVAVGAMWDDGATSTSGSAYVFTAPSLCAADLTEPFGGVLNLQDVFAYIALFNAQDPAADLAAPLGILNLQDVFAYLALFNAGCP
ncbi:MAG: hypothetical protein JKY96_00400, partial [Phycisphaerales bacterium]|nr:hypothetical protein [Phycisphaerales bacterium]